jgi:protoporphyrinogen oxidase
VGEENTVSCVIIGAGPAGLAAATKLTAAKLPTTIFEASSQVGGISKTIQYHGYRFDLGPHRFFSKSEKVNNLWNTTLGEDYFVLPRLSRIYYRNQFFNYPIKPFNALLGLGFGTSLQILLSYFTARFFPSPIEDNFEQWVSNRFGKKLYSIFFKTYTEKIWGIPCVEIRAEWAAQRIKGLSLTTALKNSLFPDRRGKITTLIDNFHYPKYGPGMMYEKMAENMQEQGGVLLNDSEVIQIDHISTIVDEQQHHQIKSIKVKSGEHIKDHALTNCLSSMPITDLIQRLSPSAPVEVCLAAKELCYRSIIVVNVVMKAAHAFADNWIYVHSPEVKLCRILNIKNWSPWMLADPEKTSLGLEYFCTEGDNLWEMSDNDLVALALSELEKIKLGKPADCIDSLVVRVPKAYPVYDMYYAKHLKTIKDYLASFSNLQMIGRYGMFKYNNMDHSILTGLYAAENIIAGAQHDLWAVNADQEYHEEEQRTLNDAVSR